MDRDRASAHARRPQLIAVDSATQRSPLDSFGGPDLISDNDIDCAGIARRTQPDEEAMAALEALFFMT